MEVNETYGGSDCALDTSCGEPGLEVGLCSVTGSSFDPPLDPFNGHLLYFNEDAFDISQRAWDFMSRYSTTAVVPSVPVLGTPLLLGAALAAGGVAALRRNRTR